MKKHIIGTYKNHICIFITLKIDNVETNYYQKLVIGLVQLDLSVLIIPSGVFIASKSDFSTLAKTAFALEYRRTSPSGKAMPSHVQPVSSSYLVVRPLIIRCKIRDLLGNESELLQFS